jgi:hypothetical protein
MDAMVFLAVAMLICGVQLAQLRREVMADRADACTDARCDPRVLLDALLATSIGEQLVIELDAILIVRPESRVADCLVSEAIGLMRGLAPSAFDELNDKILTVAIDVSAPLSRPTIFVDVAVGEASHVLILGECHAEAGNLRAASTSLLADGSERVVVTLVLEPALLLEPLGV